MKQSLLKNINVLMEIAEMKGIYAVIKAALVKSNPVCPAVTSAASGEGKTVKVAGLAAVAAREEKKRVLAVDLNRQDPALHRHFGMDLIDAENIRNEISVGKLAQASGTSFAAVYCAALRRLLQNPG